MKSEKQTQKRTRRSSSNSKKTKKQLKLSYKVLPENNLLKKAFESLGVPYDPSKLSEILSEKITINAKGNTTSTVFTPFNNTITPRDYVSPLFKGFSRGNVFFMMHFYAIPKELDNFSVTFYENQSSGELKTVNIKSGSTLVIPNGVYYKFNKVIPNDKKKKIIYATIAVCHTV